MQNHESELSPTQLTAILVATRPLRDAWRIVSGDNGRTLEEFNRALEEFMRESPSASSVSSFAVKAAALLPSKLSHLVWRINSTIKASGYAGFVGVALNDPFAESPQVNFIVVTTASGGEIHQISTQARTYFFTITTSHQLREILRTRDQIEAEELLNSSPRQIEQGTQEQNIENLRASYASSVMELLQIEIDRGNDRGRCLGYLRHLARKFNRLPPSFFLHPDDVVREGRHPVNGGGYADIYEGKFYGRRVCLKVLRFFERSDLTEFLKAFRREVIVWKNLEHPNVLPFLGCSLDLFHPHASFSMISPWLANGDLFHFLKYNPDHDRLKAVREIADALRYLHEYRPPIVHGDLRCANILVSDNGVCLLADFGLATALSATGTATSTIRGSLHWMAPELLLSESEGRSITLAPERDIYAFACTIFEVYAGQPPFHGFAAGALIKKVTKGKRPKRPDKLPAKDPSLNHVWEIVEKCWDQEPSLRPKARDVVAHLNFSDSSLEKYGLRRSTFSLGWPSKNHQKKGVLTVNETHSAPLQSLGLQPHTVSRAGSADRKEVEGDLS